MEGKAIYLALGIGQLALSEVFCVIVWVSAVCLLASGCFFGKKKKKRWGQVQSYKGKHCSLVGIQYTNIKTRRGF